MPSKLALWLVVMASWPLAAFGQIKLVEQTTTASSYTFGSGQCSNSVTIQWTYTPTVGISNSGSMRLWRTSGSCGSERLADDPPAETEVQPAIWSGVRQGTVTVDLGELPIFGTADGGVSCGQTGQEVTGYLCAALDYLVGTTVQATKVSFPITYDTKPPSVPTSVSCSAEDSALACSYAVDSDTTKVIATARAEGVDSANAEGTPTSGSGTVRLSGLTNNVNYVVGLRAVDAAGNESDELQSASVAPVLTQGFFGVLREAGSTEEGNGGCSTAGASLLPFAAVILLRARARRSER